jgi:hypothetical protein
MTFRSNEKPLTSDEMIAAAREDLDRRPGIEEMQSIDTDQIRQEIEREMPSPDELIAPASSSRPTPGRPRRRRVTRRTDGTTPAGFGMGQERSTNSIAVAVALALLVIGVAMILVVAASSTG